MDILRSFALCCASLSAAAMPSRAAEVDFNRDVRPILTKHCTACHGGVKAAGGISFVFKERALAAGESGERAIVPGDPAKSEILRRIRSTDPDVVMPQPKHGPPLGKQDTDVIERWIREGAEWKNHWAFEPPVDHGLPVVMDQSWPAVPLDHHVLAKLEKESLKPSPPAPPGEWLRRASLDLTGLPPVPEDIDRFRKDWKIDARAAKERMVDKLLASPAFGERWASLWLDLARYSDTYGFEKDPHRDIWPYRDWVIRAFNDDMPFDRFTIEQLAGDLLPDPTSDQRLATAFHRNTQCNTEGGTDDEEYRVAAVIDRVSTTWTAWQATTFACAQCHDHPYDPITQQEFYQFFAFFNSTLDHDLDDDFPKMKVAHEPARRDEASSLELGIRALFDQLNAEGAALANDAAWRAFIPDTMKTGAGKLFASANGELRAEGTLPVKNSYELGGAGTSFTAIRLDILPESDDPAKWPERGSWVNRFEVWRIDAQGTKRAIPMRDVFVDWFDAPFEPGPSGNVGAFPKLDRPRWAVFVPEQAVVMGENERLSIELKQSAATTGEQATPVRRFALRLSDRPEWIDLTKSETRAENKRRLAAMRDALKAVPGSMVPVMVERAQPRETRIFARGNRLTKEDPVDPGLPKLFVGKNAKPGQNRLTMARWLVSQDNPLTARVIANHLWAGFFGEGIVISRGDFGSSGEPPSNQDLLDHLALRLRDHHGWSVKSLLREIVLSATYGQTHRATREALARDPENRLLARGPRVRLTAEMVRDQALAVSGLLSPKLHGPPVYPPQPAGVWKSVYSGAEWKESKGEDRYRRAVYTYSKRTSGFPGFLTFDAPSRDLCSARRIRSNTPLQALVTLNDPAHIEFAQALAARMAAHADDFERKLAHGVLLCTQREASSAMLRELATLHEDARAVYAADPKLHSHLAPTPEQAALVLVANTILNLDSALNR